MTKADKEGQRKTPILRFKGFTDDWEQRKLGKQNKITMGQSPSSKNYTDNPNDWILIQGNADLKNGKVTPRLYTSQVTKKADIGDIILTVRAPVGEVAITDYKAILGRGVASIKGNLFIYFALEKFKTNNKWNMYSSGSTFDSITGKDLNNLALFFPSKMEENKIGKLLNKLDSLLALYENKRKLLTVLSQGLSQYLFNFSKEKSAIQMSLSSVTLSEAKGIAKENTLSSGNIEYLDTTRLNGGKVKLVSGKKDVDFQDIIVLWDGSNAGKIYYGFSGILGSTLKVFKLKDDINSEYVYYYLKFKQNLILHKFRTPNIPHVSKDFSQRFNLPIPDKEKQNLIANILHLNELQVNLTNKKIKKLKQIKNSLLQKIFL